MKSLKMAIMSADLSSRGNRRKAVGLVVGLFERIRAAEQSLIARMPLNLQGSDAYDIAEYFIDALDEAIDVISSVYD